MGGRREGGLADARPLLRSANAGQRFRDGAALRGVAGLPWYGQDAPRTRPRIRDARDQGRTLRCHTARLVLSWLAVRQHLTRSRRGRTTASRGRRAPWRRNRRGIAARGGGTRVVAPPEILRATFTGTAPAGRAAEASRGRAEVAGVSCP